MKIFKYIFAEIKNNHRFSLLFVLNVALGLSGYVAIDGFQNSIDHTLEQKSRDVLGADLALSARREITEAEKNIVKSLAQTEVQSTETIELFTMVSKATKENSSRLTQLVAIEDVYPFYGKIIFKSGEHSAAELNTGLVAWVYPEILSQFKISEGDPIRIGSETFKIIGTVENDSAAGIGTNMAPRVYIGHKNIESTQLLLPGTIATRSTLFKIPGKSDDELEQLRKNVFEKTPDGDLRVTTHKNSSEQVGRLLSYLNDFLGLTSLIGLFLAAMGGRYLSQGYFRSKQRDIAILISLGMTVRQALGIYTGLLIILGVISAVISLAVATLILPLLISSLSGLFPFELTFVLQSRTLLISFILGTTGSLLLCFPQLYQITQVSPALLFSRQTFEHRRSLVEILLFTIPAAILFYALTILVSHSYQVSHIFLASFVASALFLYGLSYGFMKIVAWKIQSRPTSLALFWGLRDLTRLKASTVSSFVAMGLGVLLLNVIPQIQYSIQQEIEDPNTSVLPSLFLFDIQEDQVDALKGILRNNSLDPDQVSPMIRARLTEVNDKPFDKGKGEVQGTREEENEMRFRNRGFNLSYRSGLTPSETLLEGHEFTPEFTVAKNSGDDGLAQISMEYRFAERLSLKIGDTLTFDIQSIPVKGRIVNLRKVKWTTFQPNFFIVFQPGFLEGAPKTFLATLPHLTPEKKTELQNQIVETLPNVSMVDVTQLVQRLKGIIDQMSLALTLMAYVCLLVGLLVLYSIAHNNALARRWDIGLLKSMGSAQKTISLSFLWNYGAIAFLASIFGMLMSFVTSYVFAWQLLDKSWAFSWTQPVAIFAIVLISAVSVTYWSIRSAMNVSASELLSGN
ncbi:MAG: FtsX-like permease family protein [Bdellovibrionales bacterium]|nr:FtsX-like permease family protein [Bdellovibrionales bacterium]